MSDIDSHESCISDMYEYKYHLLNSISYLEEDRLGIIMEELSKFADINDFYSDKASGYLKKTIAFVTRMINLFMKDGKFHLFRGTVSLTIKIVQGITRTSNQQKFDSLHKNYIVKIMQFISSFLESGQIHFQVAAVNLLTALIDIPFMKFSEINILYLKAVRTFDDINEIEVLGSLFFAVINRKIYIGSLRSDCSPSYLSLEMECLNFLKKVTSYNGSEINIKCLVLLYNYNGFEFSKEITSMRPFYYQVCQLFREPKYKKCAIQFLSHLIADKKYFLISPKQFFFQFQLLSERYEEWPKMKTDFFFLVAYFFLINSEWLWTNQDILEAICFQMHSCENISNDVLKSILMLYSACMGYMPDDNILKEESKSTGKIILKHLSSHENLIRLLTIHEMELGWIFSNAEDILSYRVLECWFQLETDETEIAKVFNIMKKSHILINYLVTCSDEKYMILKVSKVLRLINNDNNLTKAAHFAILQVCNDASKLEALFQIKFDVPKEPDTILKHLEILHLVLPLFKEEAAVTAACRYFYILLDFLHQFPADVAFSSTKLHELITFLLKVCCFSDDSPAIAAITLIIALLESKQFNMVVPCRNPVLVPFRRIMVGSPQRIVCGVELIKKILIQKKVFILTLSSECLPELYDLLFEIMNDETISTIVKLLKVLSQIEPGLYHTLIRSMTIKNKKSVLNNMNYKLLLTYFKFASRLF